MMPPTPGRSKILIIDDEASVADTLAIVFSTQGYETRVAYSAEAAIDILAAWPPDLAIVDVMLPHMNGIDFAIVLQSNYPKCPVVLFSGQPDTTALVDSAIRKGYSFEIFAKPLHPRLILDAVANLLSPLPAPPHDA
jgi:DNA-binding NtrC family response regulator